MVNHPNRNLTPGLREMLERIDRATLRHGALLTLSSADASRSDGQRLRRLIAEELAELCDHPTIRRDNDTPAPAVRITGAGKIALKTAGARSHQVMREHIAHIR
jgi:hypothetical protein